MPKCASPHGRHVERLIDAKAGGGLSDEKDKSVRAALVAQFQNESPETKTAIS